MQVVIDGINGFVFYCLLFSVVNWYNILMWLAFMVLIFNGLSANVCVNTFVFVVVLAYVFCF